MPVRTLDEIMAAQGGGIVTPGAANVANAMSAGYAQAQQWQIQNPILLQQHLASVGMASQLPMMASPAQMTPPGLGVFRPPPVPPSPGLRSTPGVTGFFHDPYESRVQSQMMMAQQMLNPTRATDILARQATSNQAGIAGQVLGGIAGFGIGGVTGATTGMELGGMLGGFVNDIPLVGSAWRWINKQRLGGAAQLLSGGANLQMGTMGNISLTGQDVGLGGRGMNQQASVILAKKLSQIAAETGDDFNRIDVTNLTTAAAQSGLLDTATNVDQIATTMKKLVKVMGKMAKMTGDPSFQRNMQEIANLRNFGFTIDQAVQAVGDLGSYAREAGMTRGQLMQTGGRQGMTTFAAAGLAPSVGLMSGAYGAAQARRLQGGVDPMVMSLMGGQEGVQQRTVEAQAALMSGLGPAFMGTMLDIQGTGAGARLTVDPSRVQDFLRFNRSGANIQEIMGRGTARLGDLAQRAGVSQQELMSQVWMRQPELLSRMGQQMGPEGMNTMLMQVLNALRREMGSLTQAASMMSGGDPNQARFLVEMATNPTKLKRSEEAIRERIRRATVQGREEWRAERAKKAQEDELDDTDFYHARRLAREQREQRDATMGYTRLYMPETFRQTAGGEEWRRAAQRRGTDILERGGRGGRALERQYLPQEIQDWFEMDVTDEWVSSDEYSTYLRGMGHTGIAGTLREISYGIEQELPGLASAGHRMLELVSGYVAERPGAIRLPSVEQRHRNIQRRLAAWKSAAKAARRTEGISPGEYWRGAAKMTERMGPGLIASIRKDITQLAVNQGRGQGGGLTQDALLGTIKRQLRDRGFSEAKITEIVDKNRDQWVDFSFATIRQSTDPEAKKALGDLDKLAAEATAGIRDVEGAQEYVENQKERWLEDLRDLGLVGEEIEVFGTRYRLAIDELTPGQEEALRAYKEATPEERAAMALLQDTSDEAQRQLMEMVQAKPGVVESASKKLREMSGKGKELITGIAKQIRKGAGGGGFKQLIAASQVEELMKTRLGKVLGRPESLEREIGALEKEYGEFLKPKDIESAVPVSRERRDEIESLREQLKVIREMRSTFLGDDGVAVKLNEAGNRLLDAGKSLHRELPYTSE